MPKNMFLVLLLLFPCLAMAGDTGTDAPATAGDAADTEIVIGGAAEPSSETPLLTEEESEVCASAVVAEIIEGLTVEEIPPLAREMAVALKDRCQCDAVAVRTMTDAGVPFDVSFNTIAEVCELDGTELGELSRALGPGLGGDAPGGPGGEVSP